MTHIQWPSLPVAVTAALLAATFAPAQTSSTISAKPGALNYIEGTVLVNDRRIADKEVRSTALSANDRLVTEVGKAEILLTPGIFARVGSDSELRMVSPSLTQTQLELVRGELMVEATGLLKDNNLQILDHGSTTRIKKNGLYRFTADNPPIAAVLDGKAQVTLNGQSIDLKKGRKTILADTGLKAVKFDTKAKDDLYAWSNVRSQYASALSYRASQSVSYNGFGPYGYGFGGSGWYWDAGFNSYAWVPGAGYYYNPFGYGFFSPGFVGAAPIVVAPGRGYGYAGRAGSWNRPHGDDHPGAAGRPGFNGPRPGAVGPRPGFSGAHAGFSGAHPGFGGGHAGFGGGGGAHVGGAGGRGR